MTQGITSSPGQSSVGESTKRSKDASNALDKDQFLKLLTLQLKSQNPMKPYDNQEFASQIAQFSQLEQLSDIRSLLEEQVQINQLLAQNISNSALPGLIGKNATASGNTINFDGNSDVSVNYSLNRKAENAFLIIYDEMGNIINKIELKGSNLSTGLHSYEWNGNNENGEKVSVGKYSFFITAEDNKGTPFNGELFMSGKIEGVRFKQEGTMLLINGKEVPLKDVTDITTNN